MCTMRFHQIFGRGHLVLKSRTPTGHRVSEPCLHDNRSVGYWRTRWRRWPRAPPPCPRPAEERPPPPRSPATPSSARWPTGSTSRSCSRWAADRPDSLLEACGVLRLAVGANPFLVVGRRTDGERRMETPRKRPDQRHQHRRRQHEDRPEVSGIEFYLRSHEKSKTMESTTQSSSFSFSSYADTGCDIYRVRTVMENLEKSWNFQMVISRPGKVLEKT